MRGKAASALALALALGLPQLRKRPPMTGRYAVMCARATGDREIPHELAIPLCARAAPTGTPRCFVSLLGGDGRH
jgi:hypothetical protein